MNATIANEKSMKLLFAIATGNLRILEVDIKKHFNLLSSKEIVHHLLVQCKDATWDGAENGSLARESRLRTYRTGPSRRQYVDGPDVNRLRASHAGCKRNAVCGRRHGRITELCSCTSVGAGNSGAL
jgi:hypothetical protein